MTDDFLNIVLGLVSSPFFIALFLLYVTFVLFRSAPRFSYLLLIASTGLLTVISLPITSEYLIRSLESIHSPQTWSQLEASDVGAIVLLGGAVSPPFPPREHPQLSTAGDRLLGVLRVWKENKDLPVVVTGASSNKSSDFLSEAEYTRQILVLMGVNEEKILLEENSTDTVSNVNFTEDILSERNISSIFLITSAMHMPRAVLTFELLTDLSVYPVEANIWIGTQEELSLSDWLPTATSVYGSTEAISEWLKIIFIKVFRS